MNVLQKERNKEREKERKKRMGKVKKKKKPTVLQEEWAGLV